MASPAKRAQPATHISVWIGLGLSIVGLLVAMYAYSGTRVYDITYAIVATLGGLLSLGGIMVAAWGRAIMAARAQRSRRATLQKDVLKAAEAGLAERPLPTVAEPAEKKRFALPFGSRKPKPVVEGKASSGTVFAFKAREPQPQRQPQPEPRALEIPAIESLVETPLQMEPAPQVERVTLKCPSCATQFTTEGVRPMTATCPSCGFSATV